MCLITDQWGDGCHSQATVATFRSPCSILSNNGSKRLSLVEAWSTAHTSERIRLQSWLSSAITFFSARPLLTGINSFPCCFSLTGRFLSHQPASSCLNCFTLDKQEASWTYWENTGRTQSIVTSWEWKIIDGIMRSQKVWYDQKAQTNAGGAAAAPEKKLLTKWCVPYKQKVPHSTFELQNHRNPQTCRTVL